jgi:Na+/proline symporter
METLSVLPVFFVLLVSFSISLWCARNNLAPRVDRYLFAGNTPALAFSSCLGSIVSMAISFTALISAGYEFGWQILFPLIAGALLGLLALLRLLNDKRMDPIQNEILDQNYQKGVSYFTIFDGRHSTFPAFYIFFLFFYFCMLTTELSVLRVFLQYLFNLPPPEVLVLLFMILLVCYAYVFIGGFRAVLITDYFQLIVVLTFLGFLLASADLNFVRHIPSPAVAKVHWTLAQQVILHIGCFVGSFSWTFANIDQWYRTAGTLPIKAARSVLINSVLALCAATIIPVLAGSYALRQHGIPAGTTNDISLIIVQNLLKKSNTTLRISFSMALICAALTTLNTYIMTFQQIYFEFSIRVNARNHLKYLLEYLVKWRQVRGVGLLFTALCFLVSLFVPNVYAFGVFALCGFIFSVPFLLSQAFRKNLIVSRLSARSTIGLGSSIILFPLLLFLLPRLTGSTAIHLYNIPAAAGLAVLCAHIPLLFFPPPQEVVRAEKT